MSMGQRPESRLANRMNKIRSGVIRSNPKRRAESEQSWVTRLDRVYHKAMKRAGFNKPMSMNSGKECARRRNQLETGKIYNCRNGNQYPSYSLLRRR